MQASRTIYAVLVLLLAGILSISAAGQSLVSGDVTGIITDPSGAVVPNATVTLKNNGTGQQQTTATNNSGVYRFSLMDATCVPMTTRCRLYRSATMPPRGAARNTGN